MKTHEMGTLLTSWRYSMPSMEHLYHGLRAKSQYNEKSNTELELFELVINQY